MNSKPPFVDLICYNKLQKDQFKLQLTLMHWFYEILGLNVTTVNCDDDFVCDFDFCVCSY